MQDNSLLEPTQAYQLSSITKDHSLKRDENFNIFWHNLTYKFESQSLLKRMIRKRPQTFDTGHKIIFNEICGSVQSGKLSAIMGPSGAGKSSLVNILFQNMSKGVSGAIFCEGYKGKKLKIRFIPQKDYLIEHLTMREDLTFVSKLCGIQTNLFQSSPMMKNENANLFEHKRKLNAHEVYVENIAALLGLTSCLDVSLGKISGGQQKRHSIAREIMSNPDVLILDEPTTGLDSLSCMRTIQMLKSLAEQSGKISRPIAIVVIIHQPQTEVFNLFDNAYFLSKSGRIIYDDNPKNVARVIEDVAGINMPANYNCASLLIEIASEMHGIRAIDRLSKYYKAKFLRAFNPQKLRNESKLSDKGNDFWQNQKDNGHDDPTAFNSAHTFSRPTDSIKGGKTADELGARIDDSGSSFGNEKYFICYQLRDAFSENPISLKQSFRHTFILAHRSWLSVIRNPRLTQSRLLFHILAPLLSVMIYGTYMGIPNACPQVETEIDIGNIRRDIKDGQLAKQQDDIKTSIENIGFFFVIMFALSLNTITLNSSIYPLTMQIFRKEVINGLYKPVPHLIAQTFVDLPLEILFPTITSVILYLMTNQPQSYMHWRMIGLAVSLVTTNYCVHEIGLLFGAVFVNNVNLSMFMAQSAILPLSVLSGFVVRPVRMGKLKFISYFSFYKLGLNIIIASRYGFGICPCDEDMPFGDELVIKSITPQVKHVLEYMFPKGNNSSEDSGMILSPTEMFEKLGSKYSKAQAYGLDLKSCADVKPFIMHAYGLDDSDFAMSFVYLLVMTLVIKMVTFTIVKSFPYRSIK